MAASSSTDLALANVVQFVGVAAAAFDYVENLFLLLVLRKLPHQRLTAARFAGLSTSLKSGCMFVAVGALVAALFLR